MGSFSWLRADKLTRYNNIYGGCPFKFLIPKEFGGGFIKDYYQDYGYLGHKENGKPKYDIFELIAFWNADMVYPDCKSHFENYRKVKEMLQYNGEFPALKEIDDDTDYNRIIGIDIGCLDSAVEKLKYPPKLVSASYKGTYEDCDGISYGDPEQGFYPVKRSK